MTTQEVEAKSLQSDAAYIFRPYVKDDIHFIQNSWANSYFKGASYNIYLSAEEFNASHRPIREAFFIQPNATAIICAAKEDPSLVIGWIALEKPPKADAIIVHYIYVKQAFKDMGIATELLNKANKAKYLLFTHLTEKVERIMRRNPEKYGTFFYAPHLI